MNGYSSLSLHKTSTKVAAVVVLALVVAGFFVLTPPDEYLYIVSLIGVGYGALNCLGFGAKRWQNAVLTLSLVFIYFVIRDRYIPKLTGIERVLSLLQFFGIVWLLGILVVWTKEREEGKK